MSVVAWGEFGRTPRINKVAGRDHWPRASCALLAGGGMRMGQVIGSTNRLGEEPQDRPIHYQDVFATLYHNLGNQGLQFSSVGGIVYELAKAAGKGREIPTDWFLQDIRD